MKTPTCFLLLCCVLAYSCNHGGRPMATNNQTSEFQIQLFRNDTIKANSLIGGYGYDIVKDGRLFIHQPMIPAVPGERGFATEAIASKAANFILYKLKNNIIPPSVSYLELDSLGVLEHHP